MKIVIISAVYPWPSDNGKKIVLNGFLEYLSTKYKGENITYLYIGNIEEDVYKQYGINVVTLNKPSAFMRLINVIYRSFIFQSKSIQESMLYSYSLKRNIVKRLSQLQADMVIVDTVRIGQFLKHENYWGKENSIMYMDDLFSVRYEKMIEVKRKYKNINMDSMGGFSRHIPYKLDCLVKNRFIEMILLKFEKKLIRKSETITSQYYKKNLLINSNESKLLNFLCCKKVSETVSPWLNKEGDFQREYKKNKEFIFLGSLNISHNKVSIINFIETQSDQIRSCIPNAKIRIVGKNADEKIYKLVEKNNDIFSLDGFVPDLEKLFKTACAMIIPLIFGTGVKLKTIEAMLYGLPVITTSYGAEGINLRNKVDSLIDDDISRFPQHMRFMLDEETNKYYSKMIRSTYEKYYSRSAIYQEYDKIFHTC